MEFRPEKKSEKISEEGPIPEGVSHEATPEELELIEDWEDFNSKYPEGL